MQPTELARLLSLRRWDKVVFFYTYDNQRLPPERPELLIEELRGAMRRSVEGRTLFLAELYGPLHTLFAEEVLALREEKAGVELATVERSLGGSLDASWAKLRETADYISIFPHSRSNLRKERIECVTALSDKIICYLTGARAAQSRYLVEAREKGCEVENLYPVYLERLRKLVPEKPVRRFTLGEVAALFPPGQEAVLLREADGQGVERGSLETLLTGYREVQVTRLETESGPECSRAGLLVIYTGGAKPQ